MKLMCTIADHRAVEEQVYNSGYFFGRCRRCGCDLIRTGRRQWQPVPRGYGVVWKAGRHSHSLTPDFEGLLPDLHAEANLPATRPRFASWSRAMVGRGKRALRGGAAPVEKPDEYPRLMVLAFIVGTGLSLFGGGRRTA